MRRAPHLLLLSWLLLLAPLAMADLVVVTGSKSGLERLTREEVVYVFMGRWRQLPSGSQAVPLDLAVDSPERANFYRRLVNKEPAEVRAYWSRLMFSGGSRPPHSVESRDELISLLSNNAGAIGYLERNRVDSRLRIVFDFATAP